MDRTDMPIPVETSRGLLVACLLATGRPIYAINPMAASRYRERHAVTRKKSDHLDATVLANILRTDRAAFGTLPTDSELAKAIAVLARAQQDAVWDRTQAANKLRSHLREYSPGFLASFELTREGLCHPVAGDSSRGSSHPRTGSPAQPHTAARGGLASRAQAPHRARRTVSRRP